MKKTNKVSTSKQKTKAILKIAMILISIIAILLVCFAFYPLFKNLNTVEGRLEFRNKVNSMGIKGFLLLYLLEAVQIVLVIIPGEPIELLYGMCYGSIKGAIYLTINVFINTIVVYYIVKKCGKKVLYFLFSKEKIDEFEKKPIFQSKEKIENIMALLFFLPGTPKDMLLYVGAFLPIDKWKFVLISTFARFPSVITSTIAGAGITSNNLKMTIITYIITGIIGIIIAIIDRKHNK